jgi:hypothetical protein
LAPVFFTPVWENKMDAKTTEAQRFAVYAGSGWYVSKVVRKESAPLGFGWLPVEHRRESVKQTIIFDGVAGAASLERAAAVAACHAARGAGVPVWLVRHPSCAAVGAGV